MVIIFLDVDGVLLEPKTKQLYRQENRQATLPSYVSLFDKNALDFLKDLVELIEKQGNEVGIVISSSWKEHKSVNNLKELFKICFFAKYILSKTADLACISNPEWGYVDALTRSEEIELWFNENHHVKIDNFLIIDDYDEGISELFPNNFVHCKQGSFKKDDFERAKLLISNQALKAVSSDEIPLSKIHLDIYRETKASSEMQAVKSVRLASKTYRNYVKLFFFKELSFNENCVNVMMEFLEDNDKQCKQK